jgi:hypothetical protein
VVDLEWLTRPYDIFGLGEGVLPDRLGVAAGLDVLPAEQDAAGNAVSTRKYCGWLVSAGHKMNSPAAIC